MPRITWREAIERFGSDKPDMRVDMEIVDVTDVFASGENPFSQVISEGGAVKGLLVPGGGSLSRKEIMDLEARAVALGSAGMANFQVKNGALRGPLVKFLPGDAQSRLLELSGLTSDGILFIMADRSWVRACETLGQIRLEIARDRGLTGEGWKFVWVTEFPLFEWDEESKRWSPVHHPFTAPMNEDMEHLKSNPGLARSRAYDLVLNGVELGGGSIRIHDPETQSRVFDALNISPDLARERFGFLLEALSFGTPPHGGVALGLDRIVMMICGAKSIREVIAFPKNQKAQCPMTGAPSSVEKSQTDQLYILSTAPERDDA
jgi:aspartyl-tRNA synthetase